MGLPRPVQKRPSFVDFIIFLASYESKQIKNYSKIFKKPKQISKSKVVPREIRFWWARKEIPAWQSKPELCQVEY